jgi:TfoX/Sxy family transcriptional regulator of competence genes
MAYDEDLADRVRALIGDEPEVTEQRMFGGLAFLRSGKMAIAVSGRGGIMVRVDPGRSEELERSPGVTVAEMRGRPMEGWLRVTADTLRSDAQLATWVELGIGYARSLARSPRTAAGPDTEPDTI